MGATEHLILSLWEQTVVNVGSQFNRKEFVPFIPRGAIGRIIRGENKLMFDTVASQSTAGSIFSGVRAGLGIPAGNPGTAKTTLVDQLRLVLMCMVSQRVLGTPADVTMMSVSDNASRDFRDQPHRTAEIRNTGTRSNNGAGWSLVHWVDNSTPASIMWATLEVEFEFLEPSGNPEPMDRLRRTLLVNQ